MYLTCLVHLQVDTLHLTWLVHRMHLILVIYQQDARLHFIQLSTHKVPVQLAMVDVPEGARVHLM